MKIPWRIPGLALQITVEECVAMDPDRIMISPGPGCPKGALTACQSRIQTNKPHSPCNVDAGISCDVIRTFAGKKPIFGVCLGIPIYYYVCFSALLPEHDFILALTFYLLSVKGHQCIFEVYGGTVDKGSSIMKT
jgi:anthranilate/para-aminobenzoate synthase component II